MCCLSLLLITLEGCGKQEDPTENKGTPLFAMQGTANGVPFFFEGGESDYYMFTQTQSLDHGMVSIEGKLAKQNCPVTCGPSLKIYFRNYTLNNTFFSDSLFQKGPYSFYNLYNAQNWIYRLRTYQRSTGIGAPQFGWDFGQNRFSQDAEPVVLFSAEGIYPIKCSSVFPNSCFSELVQSIYLTPTRVGKHTDFSANHLDTLELLFNSIPVNNNAQVTWDFGDGITATGSIVKHRYLKSGVYKVNMRYISGNDTMDFSQNVKTLDVQKCISNYQFTTSRQIDSLQFKTVVVEWTDKDGNVYSSIHTPQDNSVFELRAIEAYQPNSSQQQTKRLTLSFRCTLSNGTKTIQLNNVTGTFAVAIPSF